LHSVRPDRKCDQNGVSRTITLFFRLLGSSAVDRVDAVLRLSRFVVVPASFSWRFSAVERRGASASLSLARASLVSAVVREGAVRPEGLLLPASELATSASVGSASTETGSGSGSDAVAGGGGGTWSAAAGGIVSTGVATSSGVASFGLGFDSSAPSPATAAPARPAATSAAAAKRARRLRRLG